MDSKKLIRNLYQGFFHREPEADECDYWAQKCNSVVGLNEVFDAFLGSDEFRQVQLKLKKIFVPPGHFYSPIVNIESLNKFFPINSDIEEIAGIKISLQSHLAVWKILLPHLEYIPFPDQKNIDYRYYFDNPAFSYGDGSILFAMLCSHRPKRLIEIGCGYSSACAIDTIECYLDNGVQISFVDPHPELLVELLGKETVNKVTIHATEVQNTDLALFNDLENGDFLFIDSTHVLKTNSDVCHELFNILPTLNIGVFIHFHDIFWPFEYGEDWVIRENRSWNEIYALRAFLMYNDAFEIYFFNDFFVKHSTQVIRNSYPKMLKNGGGGIWLRKCK